MIPESDIMFALVQYQHDIIFALLLCCREISYETNNMNSLSVFMLKLVFSTFPNYEFDGFCVTSFVTQFQAQMTSSKVTSSDGNISRQE